MPAAKHLTWDAFASELPRRPSTDDMGGDNKVDDEEAPPDDVEHFTADGWNQKAKQIPAIAKTVASCKLEVRFATGAPYVARASAPGSNVALATFTPTDNGVGDTTIVWPADTFPPHVCSPTGLTLLSSSTSVVAGHVEEVANGVRVRTFVGGSAADVPWTLAIN
jgi:hypothetical protein